MASSGFSLPPVFPKDQRQRYKSCMRPPPPHHQSRITEGKKGMLRHGCNAGRWPRKEGPILYILAPQSRPLNLSFLTCSRHFNPLLNNTCCHRCRVFTGPRCCGNMAPALFSFTFHSGSLKGNCYYYYHYYYYLQMRTRASGWVSSPMSVTSLGSSKAGV